MQLLLRTQGVEESDEQWATRRWLKYDDYGRLIGQVAGRDARMVVAATRQGLFG